MIQEWKDGADRLGAWEGKQFAVVANQSDGIVGNALAGSSIFRFSNQSSNRIHIHQTILLESERSLGFQDFDNRSIETFLRNLS